MKDDGYKDFVLDQMSGLEALGCRAMFGGYGLYYGGAFFGIIYQGELYFKTDETTRPAYVARDMQPFRPNERQTLKSYYQVPPDVIEDRDTLIAWAKDAIAARSDNQRRW